MVIKQSASYNTPRDFFIYLLSIITLYVFFINLIFLLFAIINFYLPSPLNNYEINYNASLRWHIAALFITFPVYLYTTVMIRKDFLHYPEKRNLKIRRWLLYFTLFLAINIMMSDLGVLFYHFLGGEITAGFLYKTLIIFFSVACLFGFYFKDLHQGWSSLQAALWLWFIVILVLLTLIMGFHLTGTPNLARNQALDNKRINNLTTIQMEVIHYWQHNHRLPPSLDVLTNTLTGYSVPSDPITQLPYGYRVVSPSTFELCADFSTMSQDRNAYQPNINWNWSHPAGLYCFQRKVSPSTLLNIR